MPTIANGVSASGAKQQAYEDIRRKIISLELAPGQDLDEAQLVNAYGLSRTPIRELLIRLAGEGLIVIRRNRGASVAPLNIETLQALFEAGDFLERAIMRLACERRSEAELEDIQAHMLSYEQAVAESDADAMVAANSAFHEGFAIAAGNKYLLQGYRQILVDHERIGQLWYARDLDCNEKTNRKIIRQHRKLLRALTERSGTLGEQAATEHADFCKDGIRTFLSTGESILREIDLVPQPL